MAARLTDEQTKRIIADYVELRNYNAVAKLHGVSWWTVKDKVGKNPETVKFCEQKKERNTADILAHMELRRDKVCQIIDLYLDELLDIGQFEKLTPVQLTTALGTLIDKFTMEKRAPSEGGEGGVVLMPQVMPGERT